MIDFIIKLVLAHLIGDFLLQPANWVKDKEEKKYKSKYLYWHIGIHAITLLTVLQFNLKYVWGIILLLFSHFIIDLIKIKLRNRFNERYLFFADQSAHMLVIAGIVYIYVPYYINTELLFSTATLGLITFLLLVTVVSSVIMKVLVSKWDVNTIKENNSLVNAGAYIGMLERLFIFGFILLNFWEGIGFLLAAKSVFRFSDLSKAGDRKLTEYILIGTLLSFGLAMASGLGYQYFMSIANT
ncbi:MAG: DUF3307 domain-containing protein [Flavobacteriaceae bacterium]|nr:DUF3307 domain-containing protein [Flavobacteriaceae bacterium]